MRAMSENADSARLSGVWIRRTSTLTWTVAGALSAFTAILNAPNQTSALTQALSPDLLLYALTAALIGAMINLTVAFIAGVGMGVFLELLEWNVPSPAKQQLVLFIVVMAVLLVRVGALRKGARTGDRSTWGHGAVTTMRPGSTCCAGGSRSPASGSAVGGGGPAAPRALGRQQRALQPDLHLRRHRPVADHAHRVGRPGVARAVRSGRGRRPGRRAPGQLAAAPVVMLYGGAVTAVVAILVGLPALRMPGLFLAVTTLAFAIFMQNAVLATPCFTRARHQQDALHRACPTPAYTFVNRPTPLRHQPGLAALVRLVLARRAAAVHLHGADLARPGRGAPAGRRARQRARRGGHGHPDPAHQAAGLRAVGLHGRLRRGLLRLRHPAAQQHRHHLRPDDLVRDHLDGGHRRAGLDPRAPSSAPSTSRACPPSSAPTRPSSSSPAAWASLPSSSTCPAAWPSCCTASATWSPWASAPSRTVARGGPATRRRPVALADRRSGAVTAVAEPGPCIRPASRSRA